MAFVLFRSLLCNLQGLGFQSSFYTRDGTTTSRCLHRHSYSKSQNLHTQKTLFKMVHFHQKLGLQKVFYFLSRSPVLILIFHVFLQSCCGLFASTQPESKPRSGPWEFGMRLLRTRVSKVTKAITYPQSSRSCYFSILISSISRITHMIGSALFAALRIYLTTWFPNKFCLSLAFAKVKSIFSKGAWIQFAFFYFSFSD